MPPTKKEAKPKEMFKPYDRAAVPDIMPFPELAGVATTKGEETAVPKLNQHQRSWIHDVALRGIDLASLSTKAAAAACYDKIKTDAFDEKAFQHVAQDGDHIEEGRLPALITAWKRENAKKNKKSVENDIDATEEDEGARVGLLRGYTKAGWRLVNTLLLTSHSEGGADDHQRRFRRSSVINGRRKTASVRPRATRGNPSQTFLRWRWRSCLGWAHTPAETNSVKIATTKSTSIQRVCLAQ
jgi:hypothetical protein